MIYLSIGVLQENPTKEKCMVKCGSRITELTGDVLNVWLKGRLKFAECDAEKTEIVEELSNNGLVVVGEENDYDTKYIMFYRCLVSSAKTEKKVEMTENEKDVYQWLRFSPLMLDIAELLSLYERNLKVNFKYIGKDKGQDLIKLILEPHGPNKDYNFLNKMYYSVKRDELVDIFTSLLSKGRLILIGRKDCYA